MEQHISSKSFFESALPVWWPVILGLLALYIPTFYRLFISLWATEAQSHGPIIFFLSIWLIYRRWHQLRQGSSFGASAAGGSLFIAGLALYVIGRSQNIIQFELGSIIPLLTGILLVQFGWRALGILWFPLFFLLFMIPLPGTIVIKLTMPMKMAVSYIAENLLYWAGYPVARSGVILQIGQYQLLVADACAGLQTLLTLEAMGLFYLNVVKHSSLFRNLTLACMIIPISFIANIIRVLALTLVTYYLGEAAGQGFLHVFAGVLLFLSALLLIMGVDRLLQYIVKLRGSDLRKAD